MTEDHLRHSPLREKVLEHLFVADCLRALWSQGDREVDVLSPAVDAGGYDMAIENRGILRHIQLKSSSTRSRATGHLVDGRLRLKPSGCVVWVRFHPGAMRLGPFGWFGGAPGQPLAPLDGFPMARGAKGDGESFRGQRTTSYWVPVSAFEKLPDVDALVERLFGPRPEARAHH
jgi:hypothetical protein